MKREYHGVVPEDTVALEDILGYRFRQPQLLQRALTHRSCPGDSRSRQLHNERLEFLGDSVLGLVISHYLFATFPHEPEGRLSKIRSFIVNEKTLARISREKLQLGRFLHIGKGEHHTGGRSKPSILADAMEAIIAAIYLDSDLDQVTRVVLELMAQEVDAVVRNKDHSDYKTELQELSQGSLGEAPEYQVSREWGPDHQKHFAVTLYLGGRKYGYGEGTSKKNAEQKAAQAALELLRQELAQRPEEVTP
ncbi:ribonuclease III [Desulfurispira natronophila]|uniref:Ribonuclease 3 n=1 Tax=Desulfurispira natronophila TaxID=682562 RepID=A0A7W7Y4M9_9BACT|nr:ribonuclease III [Desulfurispira natronophila]MBB5022018.1 ribonuclease-3 [Desulfurispira natronophila]